jgi:hypothetical protein
MLAKGYFSHENTNISVGLFGLSNVFNDLTPNKMAQITNRLLGFC